MQYRISHFEREYVIKKIVCDHDTIDQLKVRERSGEKKYHQKNLIGTYLIF